jgi:hypothetical protein
MVNSPVEKISHQLERYEEDLLRERVGEVCARSTRMAMAGKA